MLTILQTRFPDYEPVASMAAHALAIDLDIENILASSETVDKAKLTEMRMTSVSAHAHVAKYVTPQLKAIEHTGLAKLTVSIKDLSGAK